MLWYYINICWNECTKGEAVGMENTGWMEEVLSKTPEVEGWIWVLNIGLGKWELVNILDGRWILIAWEDTKLLEYGV